MSGLLALLFSDGSMSVLPPGSTIEKAEDERVFSDKGERDPTKLTKIARVEVTILDIIETPAPTTAPTRPHCGKPQQGEASK